MLSVFSREGVYSADFCFCLVLQGDCSCVTNRETLEGCLFFSPCFSFAMCFNLGCPQQDSELSFHDGNKFLFYF